jgi:hypothetical protein
MENKEQTVTPEVAPVTPTGRKSGERVKESLVIIDRKLTNDGGVILITQKSAINPPAEGEKNSVFKIHPKMYNGLANSLGMPAFLLNDYLIGSKYEVEAFWKMQGEAWKDEKRGNAGTYSVTGFQIDRTGIALSEGHKTEIRRAKLNAYATSAFSGVGVNTAVAQPVHQTEGEAAPKGEDFVL